MFVRTLLAVFSLSIALAGAANAQLADKKAMTLGEARKIVAAAEAEAAKNNFTMCIVVVDDGGSLVLLEKMDETQIGSIDVAIEKARTAARFKRPSKVFEDAVAGGRNVVLNLGVMPIEGGVPLIAGGKVVGAIGVSGGTAAQDGQVANAGAAVLK